MMSENLERMIRLADEFFQVKNDPAQISVNNDVIDRLKAIDPDTLSEITNEKGPIAWILVIPTTSRVMVHFISGTITEQELLDQTHPGEKYDAIYLCSALVLPEYRKKGLARGLTIDAIQSIRQRHGIKDLFVWSFSTEGDHLASVIAEACSLPLHRRTAPAH
jgi:ribosomal protein S18 acetylase RimI-like enzyme